MTLEEAKARIVRLEEVLENCRGLSEIRAKELRGIKVEREHIINAVKNRLSDVPGVRAVSVEPILSIDVVVDSIDVRGKVYNEEMRLMDEFPGIQMEIHCLIKEDEFNG